MKWKLVPEEPTIEMREALGGCVLGTLAAYKAMLAAAPQPEHEAAQNWAAQNLTERDWKGISGAVAFHLIERHADGWGQIDEMMEAWREANSTENKS